MRQLRRKGPDLREYWLWYGRNWLTWGAKNSAPGVESSIPPPFTLGDLRPDSPPGPPSAGWRVWQVLSILAVIAVVAFVVWSIFFLHA